MSPPLTSHPLSQHLSTEANITTEPTPAVVLMDIFSMPDCVRHGLPPEFSGMAFGFFPAVKVYDRGGVKVMVFPVIPVILWTRLMARSGPSVAMTRLVSSSWSNMMRLLTMNPPGLDENTTLVDPFVYPLANACPELQPY